MMMLSQKILCEDTETLLIIKMYFRTIRSMYINYNSCYLHTAMKACSMKIMSSLHHLSLNPIIPAVLACLIERLWVLNQQSNHLTLIRRQGLKYFELLNSWDNI